MLIEIAISGKKEAFKKPSSPLKSLWKKHGFDLSQQVFVEGKSVFKICFYTSSGSQARKFQKDFLARSFSKLSCTLTRFEEKDWQDAWKKDYHSQPLGESFYLIPLDAGRKPPKKRPAKKIPIYLDPQGAFGSGTHETTKLMIRMMEKLKGKFDSFLDVGTGTGILVIVASHLGAKNIVGIDIEKASTKTAAHNFKLNHLKGGIFKAIRGEKFKGKTFDLVAANMISKELISCKSNLLRFVKPGGDLIVSGILQKNISDFKREFIKDSNLKLKDLFKEKSWVGLWLQKKR